MFSKRNKKPNPQEALDYHEGTRPGKIEVIPTKPYSSQRDLSLAYSPGVAEPCKKIAKNPEDAYKYTSKGNLVAVISNGTAVLGLGDIGPLASKPVMEGKGVLFKIFADIDVYDIEVNQTDMESFIQTIKAISPTFGGINLEDIKAPECFEIERRLRKELDIPVMHDDQHGTAIITSAALINALELVGKELSKIKLVVNGAGASAISCTNLFMELGVKKENIVMLDSKGVIKRSRENLSELKAFFATDNEQLNDLSDAIKDADVFLGLSRKGVLTSEMVKTMSNDPIIFALANPDPEIDYYEAKSSRPDIIMATGRSDFPNQVNNVLGFPYIFRGALDVRATSINKEMKLAAVRAIADLAKATVPQEVSDAYDKKNIKFGRDFIIPKPLDNRLITCVAPAVAKAAMESGVALYPIKDFDKYKEVLEKRLGIGNKLLDKMTENAKKQPRKVVFAEAENYKILKASQTVLEEGIAFPILLGKKNKIKAVIEKYQLDLGNTPIIDPRDKESIDKRMEYSQLLYERRKRRGITRDESIDLLRKRNYFGAAMVAKGDADAFISGLTRGYKSTITSCLQTIGVDKNVRKIAGMYLLFTKYGPMFFADTTVNLNPSVEDIVSITQLTTKTVRKFGITPRVALLSYSNFGSTSGEEPLKMREAVRLLKEREPNLVVDGEIQANFAIDKTLRQEIFPFSSLADKDANTFIFPNLSSGNIAYKLIQKMSEVESIGPILMGMKKPAHILQMGSSVRDIVNMVTFAVNDVNKLKN